MPGPAPRHVAILPWGDVVEDFLDPIGRTLDDFVHGITGWLWGYVQALATRGVRATVIVVSRTARRPGHVVHESTGTPLVVLPSPWRHRLARRLRATHLAPYLATPLVALTTAVRREGCDALLCQEYEWARFDACVAVGALTGIPVFATFQGGDFQASRYAKLVRRTSLARAAGVIIAAAGERERVRARYGIAPERIAAVPNPIDLEFWFPDDRLAARAALGLPPDAVLAVWHGRVDVQSKGLDVLLDAWAAVRRARPDVDLRLLMVGTGPDAERLARRVAGDQSVLRVDEYLLDRAAMRRHLSAADLYLLPSRHEGQPVALMEAMACGLPVAAARASGVAELVGDGADAAGVLVPIGDAPALADAIGRLVDDDNARSECAARARARIAAQCSPEAVGRALHDFMAARLVARGTRGRDRSSSG